MPDGEISIESRLRWLCRRGMLELDAWLTLVSR
jgi:succinate dehydrogenase flavin-adding protein (antitoxin of CptAB toxin-antitoxin module)